MSQNPSDLTGSALNFTGLTVLGNPSHHKRGAYRGRPIVWAFFLHRGQKQGKPEAYAGMKDVMFVCVCVSVSACAYRGQRTTLDVFLQESSMFRETEIA